MLGGYRTDFTDPGTNGRAEHAQNRAVISKASKIFLIKLNVSYGKIRKIGRYRERGSAVHFRGFRVKIMPLLSSSNDWGVVSAEIFNVERGFKGEDLENVVAERMGHGVQLSFESVVTSDKRYGENIKLRKVKMGKVDEVEWLGARRLEVRIGKLRENQVVYDCVIVYLNYHVVLESV